jgi:hypothetical protein
MNHSVYNNFVAFPLRQWLQERGLMFLYVYIASYARFIILIVHIIWEFHDYIRTIKSTVAMECCLTVKY